MNRRGLVAAAAVTLSCLLPAQALAWPEPLDLSVADAPLRPGDDQEETNSPDETNEDTTKKGATKKDAGTRQSAPPVGAPPDTPVLPPTTVRGTQTPAAAPGQGPRASTNSGPSPNSSPGASPEPFPTRTLSPDTLLTPGRTSTSARENASSISVITQEQLLATQQSTVLEALRRTVGLDVVQSGGPGRSTSVFLRGANSEHTKVLLDGIALNDPSSPTRAFDFSTLQVENIERIEIVRGPQSVVYGSDAIGGVINIVTKRGSGPPRPYATLMGGSYGTHQESVGLSGGNDRRYYSFGASFFNSDGFSAVQRRFGGFESDGYRNATCTGRFGWTPTAAVNVDYVFRYINADIQVDDFLADNPLRANKRHQFFQRVQLQSLTLDGMVDQRVGFNLTNYDLLDTAPDFFSPSRFDGQSRQVDWQANLLLTDNNTFTTGVDYMQEEASSSLLAQQGQNLAGVYLQDQQRIGERSFTTVGVRWDDSSVAGAAETYRLAQLLRVDETGTAFHASLGRGFRVPAIAQRFGFAGNPLLRPEFSKGWDVGMQQTLSEGSLILDATYFRNDFQDLIVFNFPSFLLENVGRARTSGVELTASWQANDRTWLNLGYTHTDPLNLDTGKLLLRRPREKASFGVQRRSFSRRATGNLYFQFVGPRADFDDVGSQTRLKDYIVVNVSGEYQITRRWQLFARVDNLFGENYEEVFGFNTPGISVFGGTRLVW